MARKLRGYGLVRRGEHLSLHPTEKEAHDALLQEFENSKVDMGLGWTVYTLKREDVWIEEVYNQSW